MRIKWLKTKTLEYYMGQWHASHNHESFVYDHLLETQSYTICHCQLSAQWLDCIAVHFGSRYLHLPSPKFAIMAMEPHSRQSIIQRIKPWVVFMGSYLNQCLLSETFNAVHIHSVALLLKLLVTGVFYWKLLLSGNSLVFDLDLSCSLKGKFIFY